MNYAAACREKGVHQNFMNEIVDRTGSVQSVELCNVKSTLQGQFDYQKLLTHLIVVSYLAWKSHKWTFLSATQGDQYNFTN